MSFWDRFRKKTKAEENPAAEEKQKPEWNDIVYTRKDLNIHDAVQRREYVQNCLIQMAEGGRELDNLQFEYRTVTSYLQDMEEIDALPPQKHKQLETCAQKILEHEQQREQFMNRKSRWRRTKPDRLGWDGRFLAVWK